MAKKTPPKTDTLSSQVLEYFRKYSGDQNLSSYLRGVLPQQQQESEVRNVDEVNKPVGDGLSVRSGEELIVQSENNSNIDQTIERESNISPTSSLTSNRKLEWDNGADIGYENSNNRANLHKSFSLPTLFTTLEKNVTEKPLKLRLLETNEDNSPKIYYSTTESSDKSIKPSSSSSYRSEEHKFDTTTSSSFAFKPWPSERDKKVGSPMAQSTPNTNRPGYKRAYSSDSPSTIISNVSKSDENYHKMTVTELKCVAKFKKSKIIKLSLTKPIAIDCFNYKECNDKDIQTNGGVKSESIGIQTDEQPPISDNYDDFTKKLEHIEGLIDKPEKQVVEYVKYGSDSSERHSSKSIGTNTISDLVSNCNSFEFLGPEDVERIQSNKDLDENKCLKDAGTSGTDKKIFKKNLDEKNSNSNSNENSDKHLSTPLGDMICNLSRGRNVDVEKTVMLLKRLLKSKRYDKITKEYFVKKIIEKMVKLNSSSSENSSINQKEMHNHQQNDPNKLDFNQNGESSSSSKEVSEKLLEPSLNKRLQENVPWIPGTFNKDVTKLKKLEIKTFSTDILPENNQSKRKVKDSRFTLTSSILNQPQTNSSSDNQEQNNFKNWKEDVTQSEKRLFESNSKGDGDKTDSLVKFAKRERENQLNWINNEISHLNKLKELLQKNYFESSLKKDEENKMDLKNNIKNDDVNLKNDQINLKNDKPNLEIEVLTKPHIEDMKKIKNSAAVYVITTDKSRRRNDNQQKNASRKNSEVREAKMVSSEVYKSDKPFTCIRRYIFEIPIECECDCDKYPCSHVDVTTCTPDICGCSGTDEHQQVPKKQPDHVLIKETYISPSRSKISQNQSRLFPGGKRSKNVNTDFTWDDDLDPPEGFRDITQRLMPPQKFYDEAFPGYDKSSMTEQGYEYASKFVTTRDNNQHIPLEEASIDKASMTEQGCLCDRGVQCSCTIATRVASPQTDLVQTKSRSTNCKCTSQECLFDKGVQCLCQTRVASPQTIPVQTRSRSIEPIYQKSKDKSDMSFGTNTDDRFRRSVDLPSAMSTSTAKKRSSPTYSKSTPEYTDYKRFSEEPQRVNYQRNQQQKNYERVSSSSSSSTTSSSQTILIKICPCCKQKRPPVNKATINKYRSVLQGLPEELNESLCQSCHLNTKLTIDPQTGLYKMTPGHICNCYTLMRTQTVNKIKQTVKKLEELENEATEETPCSCSKKKCVCGHSKKGIAYTLTLEDDEYYSDQECPKRKRSLDEIKLKIPTLRKKSKHSRRHKKKKEKSCDHSRITLQDYLCINRPNFIQNAEERRKTLIELAYLREERCQKYKQLLAKTKGVIPNEGENKKTKKSLYSSVEMKEITAKTYKKLPEVQNKLKERRENNNRRANRLLADMFNKKIQQNALKGIVDLSTRASVIKFI